MSATFMFTNCCRPDVNPHHRVMRDEPGPSAHLSSRLPDPLGDERYAVPGGSSLIARVSDDAPAAGLGTATLNGQMSLASLPRLLRDDPGLTQAFGNPELYWRIADANAVTDPLELTDEIGERVAIPSPNGL